MAFRLSHVMLFLQDTMSSSEDYLATLDKVAATAEKVGGVDMIASGALGEIIGDERCRQLDQLRETPKYQALSEPVRAGGIRVTNVRTMSLDELLHKK